MTLRPFILPIGDFYPQDAEGYVLNRCGWGKVGPEWQDLIRAAADWLEETWGDQLVGVYLRGSVPAGTAVAGISDLDTFALLEWRSGEEFIRWEESPGAKEKAIVLERAYPVAASVELMCAHCDPAGPGRNPQLEMVMQTQSLCLRGRDILPELPRYRPGPSMMIHSRWFSSDLEAFRKQAQPRAAEVRTFLKALIRTGFEQVMEREGRFATDLYPCLQAFGRHCPEWKEAMETSLEVYLDPEGKRDLLPGIVNGVAGWLAEQTKSLP